jgi:glycosyltransferase involved in cell wall biosynthesis
MKKALHIIYGFGTGGAETWLVQVMKYVQANPQLGLQIDFLATGGERQVFDDEIIKAGARIFYLKYDLKKILSFRKSFVALLEKEKYTVIHDHQDFVSGWHFLAAIGHLPDKRIVHLHNSYNFVRNYITSPFRWISFNLGRLFIALLGTTITGASNEVMDEYGYNNWPYSKKRGNPVYCGFNVNQFLYNEDKRRKIRTELGWEDEAIKIALFVGRIGLDDNAKAVNEKNPSFAFFIAQQLVRENKEWRFLFVGYKGIQGGEMEEKINRIGLADKIKFIGLRKDVPSLMSASDVLVFPSLWEGLGMVVVEAQASGLPVVMSDTMPRESIINRELVKIERLNNNVEEWTEAIKDISGKDSSGRTSCANKIAISPFAIDHSVYNMLNLYA